MGGNALKNTYIERKNTIEFNRIGNEIKNKISVDLGLDCVVLKCYHNKESHGDLDLLIKIPKNIYIDIKKYIIGAFKPNEIFSNGGVFSFDYQQFQIDFIPINENKFEIAQVYGFYDPIGNIMGKTYHKFGLSYGSSGLVYKYRSETGKYQDDIFLTANPKTIFDLGGYNYDRFLLGFDTLNDIYEFVINSKYFDSEMFQIENLKHVDRKRNRKRGSYHKFLEYLKENNIYKSFEFKSKKEYQQMIIDLFPEARISERIKVLDEKERKNKIIAQKFNGDMIMSWIPNITGIEMGKAIIRFKESLGDDYDEFILNNSYDRIRDYFLDVNNG